NDPSSVRSSAWPKISVGRGKNWGRSSPVALAASQATRKSSGEAMPIARSGHSRRAEVPLTPRRRSRRSAAGVVGRGAEDLIAQLRPDLVEERAEIGRGAHLEPARAAEADREELLDATWA